MKIIFDSEEQKQAFVGMYCPMAFGYTKGTDGDCGNCEECLGKFIDMEVKKSCELKFMTITEMAKEVAEEAIDGYMYEGKTIRQWIEVLKDFEDEQSAIKRILDNVNEELDFSVNCCGPEEAQYRKGVRYVRKLLYREVG